MSVRRCMQDVHFRTLEEFLDVPWGKQTQEGVRFSFTQGHLLDDPEGYPDRGTEKTSLLV